MNFRQHVAAQIAKIETLPLADRPFSARIAIAKVVEGVARLHDMPFKRACRNFVEKTLDEDLESGFPELAHLLSIAGFDADDRRKITVTMLREWHREGQVPALNEIPDGNWHTPEEYAAMARARHLGIDAPKTVSGMKKLLERRAEGQPELARSRKV